ncbi:unnamed protein product [Dovyalis caffra]|uniref:Uncharacterized protein n=1 Tax=Dovyalis caffra TaxID=77055 RepID=A0AAV1RMD5_9ROSI|nr:unnamed protein product [Dovyalis caffra]
MARQLLILSSLQQFRKLSIILSGSCTQLASSGDPTNAITIGKAHFVNRLQGHSSRTGAPTTARGPILGAQKRTRYGGVGKSVRKLAPLIRMAYVSVFPFHRTKYSTFLPRPRTSRIVSEFLKCLHSVPQKSNS